MKICQYCSEEIPEESTLCPKCGKALTPEENRQEAAPEQTAQPLAAEEASQEAPAETQEATEETPAETAQETTQEASPESTQEAPEETAPDSAEELPLTPAAPAVTPWKIGLAVVAVVLLAAALLAVIFAGRTPAAVEATQPGQTTAGEPSVPETTVPATVPADGEAGTVTEKGTYTVDDDTALASRDTVVATIGDKEMTNGMLQVYYWMQVQGFWNNYGAYAPYFGLDFTKPLDTQVSMEDPSLTWQHYFLQGALDTWQQVVALSAEAEAADLEMDPEVQAHLDGLEDSVAQMAQSNDMTVEELLYNNFGKGAGMEEYRIFQENYSRGLPYYLERTENLEPSQEELEAYYEKNKEGYESSGLSKEDKFVDVRHILVQVEGGTTAEDGTTTYSDEEWEACRTAAQEILDQWLAGEKTEDSFAALATEKTQDPGSQGTGGLYQQVYPGQMVQPFDEWCFDESRQYGDYGLVQTSYGYHVMFFVSSQPQWEYYATSDWKMEQTNNLIMELVEKYPLEVDYSKIALGVAPMG